MASSNPYHHHQHQPQHQPQHHHQPQHQQHQPQHQPQHQQHQQHHVPGHAPTQTAPSYYQQERHFMAQFGDIVSQPKKMASGGAADQARQQQSVQATSALGIHVVSEPGAPNAVQDAAAQRGAQLEIPPCKCQCSSKFQDPLAIAASFQGLQLRERTNIARIIAYFNSAHPKDTTKRNELLKHQDAKTRPGGKRLQLPYSIRGQRVCASFFCAVLGIAPRTIQRLAHSLPIEEYAPASDKGRSSRRKDRPTKSTLVAVAFLDFIYDTFSPAHPSLTHTQAVTSLRFLPVTFSIADTYQLYLQHMQHVHAMVADQSKIKQLQSGSFERVWREKRPNYRIFRTPADECTQCRQHKRFASALKKAPTSPQIQEATAALATMRQAHSATEHDKDATHKLYWDRSRLEPDSIDVFEVKFGSRMFLPQSLNSVDTHTYTPGLAVDFFCVSCAHARKPGPSQYTFVLQEGHWPSYANLAASELSMFYHIVSQCQSDPKRDSCVIYADAADEALFPMLLQFCAFLSETTSYSQIELCHISPGHGTPHTRSPGTLIPPTAPGAAPQSLVKTPGQAFAQVASMPEVKAIAPCRDGVIWYDWTTFFQNALQQDSIPAIPRDAYPSYIFQEGALCGKLMAGPGSQITILAKPTFNIGAHELLTALPQYPLSSWRTLCNVDMHHQSNRFERIVSLANRHGMSNHLTELFDCGHANCQYDFASQQRASVDSMPALPPELAAFGAATDILVQDPHGPTKRAKKQNACGNCGKRGHNRKTCTEPPNPATSA
eukprot:m.170299 g.170299  ORF g.170299 m.170299 type:complete len:775 (+) comp14527_c2_seq5:85-2409(+)